MHPATRRTILFFICLALPAVVLMPSYGFSKTADTIYPAAIFPFQEKSPSLNGYGDKVGDLLFVQLSENPSLVFVDRQELNKILDEQELTLSGMVNPNQAVQIGKLTGAKILITGSVMQMDSRIFLIAKIIGTETSRVLGVSVNGKASDDIFPLVQSLAQKVSAKISAQSGSLVAKPKTDHDRLRALKKALGNKKRPSVSVAISERHIGLATIDPAAETEIIKFCTETGFPVIDTSTKSYKKPDIRIVGEGFSEFGTRWSAKARLEVKAVDTRTNEVIAIDRQTVVNVDLSERIAGKKALQDAAAMIAERMLPKLVK